MALTWALAAAGTTGNALVIKKCIWAGSPLNRFVAVGSRSGAIPTSTGCVWTSSDGVTWTLRTAANGYTWTSVAFSPTLGSGSGRLVAVTSSILTGGAVPITDQVMYSDNGGVTWTAATSAERSAWNDVVWADTLSLFVAVSQTGTNRVQTSPDGITWTGQSAASAKSWSGIAWNGTTLVAVAGTSGTSSVMTSTNGTLWTAQTTPSTAQFRNRSISYSTTLTMFLAVSSVASVVTVFRSTDSGVTWAAWAGAPASWSANNGNQVVWSPEAALWMLTAGNGDDHVATSPDGITWTRVLISDVGGDDFFHTWDALAYSPTLSQFALHDQTAHDVVAVATSASVASLTPTSARDSGDVTVTLTGTGVNGGFTNQAGTNFLVVFYPFTALGLSAPDFVTNYFLGGSYQFGLHASAVTWVNSTTLTCTPPHGCGEGSQYGLAAGPISVDVAVFDLSKFLVSDPNCQFYMAAAFTYVDPVMLSISPTSGTVLGGGTVTITGTNFYPDEGLFGLGTSVLHFGQAPAFCTYVNQTTMTCVAPSFYGGVGVSPIVDVRFEPSHLSNPLSLSPFAVFVPASTTLVAGYTYMPVWWVFDPTLGFEFEFFDLAWEDFDFGFGIGDLGSDQFVWYYYGLVAPDSEAGSTRRRGWVLYGSGSTAPSTDGWWLSLDGFAGSILIVANSRPKNPRTWANFATFATGTAAMLGGSPGYGCVLQNKLIYAASGYTTFPPLRIFDGTFDRELCTLPPTAAGVTPYAIVSLLAANGTIYVSTLDTGSDSTNWVGRVFSLDIETAALTPIGAAFTTGHVPYALAWHNGRLYCGTHRQVSTAVGKIYTILPGVDTAWAEDYDLASASMTGVASMLSFQGTLFVGCTAAVGTFAKVIKRATDGTYSTAETGSGGVATANNGFLSLAEYSSKIYAGYWNNDTPAITSIRKSSDGTTWSVSYTGATTTLRPIIALFVDDGVLYAIGGGLALTAAILSTLDGVTWTNLTAHLPDTGETALPVFGVVVF